MEVIPLENHYTVKQAAGGLGVSTKTIRSRIANKELFAIWEDLGRGMSRWQIPCSIIDTPSEIETIPLTKPLTPTLDFTEMGNLVHTAVQSAVQGVIQTELRQLREDMEARADQRDQRLMEVIRAVQGNKQIPWWKKILG